MRAPFILFGFQAPALLLGLHPEEVVFGKPVLIRQFLQVLFCRTIPCILPNGLDGIVPN